MLALGEETAVQAVVGYIVWTFRRLKKPKNREMSAGDYALHSVAPTFLFLHSIDKITKFLYYQIYFKAKYKVKNLNNSADLNSAHINVVQCQ